VNNLLIEEKLENLVAKIVDVSWQGVGKPAENSKLNYEIESERQRNGLI